MSSSTPNNFLGDLDCRYLDGRRWLILAPFEYHLGSPDGPEYVRIVAGDTTDFASIPRLIKVIWPSPGGPWDKPSVIHDKLYATALILHINGTQRVCERPEADAIFLEAMGVTRTPEFPRHAMYEGVRVGGWKPWGHYRSMSAAR